MKRLLQKFTVRDLVLIAAMAALGIAIKPVVVPLAHLVSTPLMIPGGALAGGLYMMCTERRCSSGSCRQSW